MCQAEQSAIVATVEQEAAKFDALTGQIGVCDAVIPAQAGIQQDYIFA